MKCLTLLKNRSDEAFNASLPRFIASSLSTLYKVEEIAIKRCMTSQHICDGRFSSFPRKYVDDLFLNCQSKSSFDRFYALIFFFVKALRQWRQIREAMK
jgi:hypothetical protein